MGHKGWGESCWDGVGHVGWGGSCWGGWGVSCRGGMGHAVVVWGWAGAYRCGMRSGGSYRGGMGWVMKNIKLMVLQGI